MTRTTNSLTTQELSIPVEAGKIQGTLAAPGKAIGVIVFAHGSGSSRLSPRNRYVASVLQQQGFATVLFDLLTPEEENDRTNVFDIELLATRVHLAERKVRQLLPNLPVGYFGASTGAAAALVAAARFPKDVAAVVSRGGRPDLAGASLPNVMAPTLLLVGGNDDVVITMNQDAAKHMQCKNELVIIPGATHLFEEPGTLEEVAKLAAAWFAKYLLPQQESQNPNTSKNFG